MTPQLRSFAKRLIDSEALSNKSSAAQAAEVFPVIDKLRPHLATLMGDGGVRALLSRALVLATEEVSWLDAVQVNVDGGLEGYEALGWQLDQSEFVLGRAVLLAQLLGLLVAFIGPSLTSRLLGEIWPQIPFNEWDLGMEVKSEKTN